MRLLLFLLSLVLLAKTPTPPNKRITVLSLSQAVYERARKLAQRTQEARLFPLRKKQGSIRVPTADGAKLFRDKVSRVLTENVTYKYLGYLPRVAVHLVEKSYWEGEEILTEVVLVVRADGHILQLPGEPYYSPDLRRVATYWSSPNFNEGTTGNVQLLVPQVTTAAVQWEDYSEKWEPTESFWESDSTVCLKRRWHHPVHYTYTSAASEELANKTDAGRFRDYGPSDNSICAAAC